MLLSSLFPDDATRVYKLLELPIWTCHRTRGVFTEPAARRRSPTA